MARGDNAVRASVIRAKARELLGRDSESLSDRMFVRVLKDAHDNGVVDLRRRGDDFEVAPAAEAESVADQLAKAAAATAPQITAPSTPQPRVGMGPRGAGRGRGKSGEVPAGLLSIGVVNEPAPAPVAALVTEEEAPAAPARGRKTAAKKKSAAKPATDEAEKPKRAKAAGPAKARAKKPAARSAT